MHFDMISIKGEINYEFEDYFTDQYELRDRILPYLFGIYGSSNPNLISEIERKITDGGAQYYKIFDAWKTQFIAEVKYNEETLYS